MKIVTKLTCATFALPLIACNAASNDYSSFSIKKELIEINTNGGTWEDGINNPVQISGTSSDAVKGTDQNSVDDGKYYKLPKYTPKYVDHKDCTWTRVKYAHDGDTFNVEWLTDKWGQVWTTGTTSSGSEIDSIAIRTIGIDTDEISTTGGTPTDKGFDQMKYIKKLLQPGDAVCLLRDSGSGDKSYNRFLRWVLIDKPTKIGDLLGLQVDVNATRDDLEKISKNHQDGEFAKTYYPKFKDYYSFNFAAIMTANVDANADCGRFATVERTEIRNEVKGCPEYAYY